MRLPSPPAVRLDPLMFRLLLVLPTLIALAAAQAAARPNIIWIVGEDMGPELGSYGDPHAITPNLDRLASEGARWTRCFTHAPICAPSRCGLITGRYPTSIGAQHMRSRVVNPPPSFTSLLRKGGVHVAWPGKTDFNFADPADFADSRTPWWKSPPPKQPFFNYINLQETHESQIRNDGHMFGDNTRRLTSAQRHDPAKMVLPPYHPDVPEVREDLARYYDLCTAVDYRVGDVLAWIDEHRLRENTVVIFFGDHGRGLPRSKRWLYDSGTRVPLIVRWPGQLAPGTVREDLVGFVDLPATMLALQGTPRPVDYQGQVFLGPETAPPRKYVYGARDCMDETRDWIRTVRDVRYRYIRNHLPELPYAQPIRYMERGGTMQAWRRLHAEGKLTGSQTLFFASTKPAGELYDTAEDPHEIRNLVADPAQAAKLGELREALDRWVKETGDLGHLSVEELQQKNIIHERDPGYAERLRRRTEAK